MKKSYCLQFYHIQHNEKSIHSILASWLQFANKAPKGFGKFFDKKDPSDAPNTTKPNDADSSSKQTNPPATEQSAPKQSTGSEQTNKESSDKPLKFQYKFEFKSGGSGAGGSGAGGSGAGGGGPFGNRSDKEKIYLAAGLAIGCLIGLYALNEFMYNEIGWQEFVLK